MKLCVLISTIDERINQVASVLLPPTPGVCYVVVHQFTSISPPKTPVELLRPDVSVHPLAGKGVTYGRNLALTLADGEFALFSDDDVTYQPEYFEKIKDVLKANPHLSIAKFKIKTPDGQPVYKEYPESEYDIQSSESTGTIQLAVRHRKILEAGIRFDTRFGAGNEYLIGGDEQIFIHDALRAGLKARYFPYYIVEHPFLSTTKSLPKYDPKRIRITGALDARLNGWIALPKAFAATLRDWSSITQHQCSPISYVIKRARAALYVLLTKPK